jgi:plasmid stability protein
MLIRGLDPQTLKRLKARAKRNGRSVQSEARLAIEKTAGLGKDEVAAMIDKWRRRFAGRRFSDSAELIREDRDR